jgi:hypothetical protein
VNDLGFVETVDGLGQGVVVVVADRAGGWADPAFVDTVTRLVPLNGTLLPSARV